MDVRRIHRTQRIYNIFYKYVMMKNECSHSFHNTCLLSYPHSRLYSDSIATFGLNSWTVRKIAFESTYYIHFFEWFHPHRWPLTHQRSNACPSSCVLSVFCSPTAPPPPTDRSSARFFQPYSLAHDEFSPKTFLSLDVFCSLVFLSFSHGFV